MARRVLYETNYTFTPSTRTIVINRYIPRERMILITNATTGVPIFNFSDSRLTATSYTSATNSTGTAGPIGTTTITLSYNTTLMSSGDKLQIMIDEPNELLQPSETLMDPVGKLRVSTPQSLIDTDFEYGLQPTKWENAQLVNNRAAMNFLPNQPSNATNAYTYSGLREVFVAAPSNPAVGSYIQVNSLSYAPADGFYTVNAVSSTTAISGVAIDDTTGGFTCTSTPLIVGQLVTITGTFGGTGSITGYASGNVYRIAKTNGTTTFTLATTTGAALVTTAGTPTGLTYTATPGYNYIMKNVAPPSTFNGATGSVWWVGQSLIFTSSTYTGSAIPVTALSATTFTLATAVIADTVGGFTCTLNTGAPNLVVGQTLAITGALGGTGTIKNYASPTYYKISATNGTTTFTLTNMDGTALVTTTGTPTGLTYTYGTTITIVTTNPHGLHIGNYAVLSGWSAATAFAPNGVWNITSVPAPNVMIFQALYPPVGAITGGTLMSRPEGIFYHRPFDGGVQYNTGSSFHGYQAFRQTRRYFRYQSGKGIQMSTNAVFKPGFNVDQISNPATNVAQIRTKIAHNLAPGVSITVSGCTPTTYNVTATVIQVIDSYTFTYAITGSPGALTAGVPYVVVNSWYNSAIRVGMFDSQNGFFYEFDGQTFYATRRSSTLQLSGTIAVTQGSGTVTGTQTLFTKQVNPGDFIVIRGATYRVATVASDTSLTVLPEYRGGTIAGGVIVSKTVDIRVAQTSWNIDPMNGTGPSGYNLDITKSQMMYIDYSWYGAGAVRFGFRDIKGEIIYCHRFVNNNYQTEAYMRSGNLPGRYETNTLGNYTQVAATLAASGTTLTVANTTGFPSAGNLLIENPVATAALVGVAITGTAGQFSCTTTSGLAIGQCVTIAGTYGGTGSITGYSGGAVYRISATDGASTFTLTTLGGTALVTTAGTPTGLTYAVSAYEYCAYTGTTTTTFTGLTRGIATAAQQGGTQLASVVTTANSVTVTGASLTTSAVQLGMFITGPGIMDGTYVTSIGASTANISMAAVTSGTITANVYSMGAVNCPHTFSASAPIGVYGHTPQFSPLVSHWGTSVIMDGRFDDDKSFVFTYGTGANVAIASAAVNAVLSIRIAPSVDNGITNTFGLRELINRMQLTLRSVGLSTDGRFLVQLILNGTPSSGTWSTSLANPSSLAQVTTHAAGTTITGGEVVYAFYTEGAGGGTYTTTTQDINLIRDLGNSVVGGGTNNNVGQQIYPDGPDIMTVVVTNLEGSTRNAYARISWTEAQA